MSESAFSPARLLEAMNGMSNIDLAQRLGCARSNITMYLSGQRTPSKMTVQLMAICLGVSPVWLMGLDAPKHIEKPAPMTEDELSAVKRATIEKIKEMDDAQVEALSQIAESILRLRDK